MTTSFDSPRKLQQTGLNAADNAADPGSAALQTSPHPALPFVGAGGDDGL